ncbi:hypothetical protein VNO77_34934 [Canavalia gladiata]|uniref:Uncharacterized protein n=1 Tax=Canavalia gladiata TaxID=3824 RepID=A0AAN9KER6_CANGL
MAILREGGGTLSSNSLHQKFSKKRRNSYEVILESHKQRRRTLPRFHRFAFFPYASCKVNFSTSREVSVYHSYGTLFDVWMEIIRVEPAFPRIDHALTITSPQNDEILTISEIAEILKEENSSHDSSVESPTDSSMHQALEEMFTDKRMLHSRLDGLISIGCNLACTLNLAIKGYCHISPLAHSLGMKTRLKGSSEVSQPLLLTMRYPKARMGSLESSQVEARSGQHVTFQKEQNPVSLH